MSDFSPFTAIANGLANLAIVSPNQTVGYQPTPANGEPPPAFLFHIEDDNEIVQESEITDNYVENNTVIQDHWALRSPTVRVHGFIGELNDSPLGQQNLLPLPAFVQPVITTGLSIISDFLPGLSISANNIVNAAFQGYQAASAVANSAVSAWNSLINGAPGVQNKQQAAFQYFFGQLQARSLWKIQTPWAVMDTMAIQSFRTVQEGGSRVITDFYITFKKIRFADAFQTTPPAVLAGRAIAQAASAIANGTNTLTNAGTLGAQFASSFPGL